MASLMFRANADNRFYSEAKKLKSPRMWYVFYYDLRGKKMRVRMGPNKRTAELAKGNIEARLAKQRRGLLDPDKELKRIDIRAFREQLDDFLLTENKTLKTRTRYGGVFRKLCQFVQTHEPYLEYLDLIDGQLIERHKDFRRR